MKKPHRGLVRSYVRVMLALILLMCVHPASSAVAAGTEQPIAAGSAATPLRLYLPLLFEKPAPPADAGNWPMAGANPQRTSWSTEEVRGQLKPIWHRPIEPYIAQNVQIIAANGLLYVSTARGLVALDAESGALRWSYPTELPLGHSPTVHKGVAYVGGLDHKLYAIDAMTGRLLWTFEAGAGFQTNPLVVGGLVYLGNRDGYMYAVHAHGAEQAGRLAWKYKTDGPVLFSAAYQDNTIYFASNDSYAYALNATTGALVWKSAKLPGLGFASWWPVVAGDQVVFAGSTGYRTLIRPGGIGESTDLNDLYPNRAAEPKGALIGPTGAEPGAWAAGTTTIDASRVMNYYEAKPWRRTYFVLDRGTGQERTFDTDHDGRREYAPVPWHGTRSGARYPPVVGYDGVLYQSSNYQSDLYIPSGHISGWKFGTQFISMLTRSWAAIDEPLAYSAGGRLIYWSLTNDRGAGAFDISTPESSSQREWIYYGPNLEDLLPGYNLMLDVSIRRNDWPGPYGGPNGVYAEHGDGNPPIPYRGKVFMHRGNSVVAFGDYSGTPTRGSLLRIPETQPQPTRVPATTELQGMLAGEVGKIVAAGHLRPGYATAGLFDGPGERECGDYLLDYWHNPADIIYALTLALPHLPADLQARTRAYLAAEFAAYPPYQYTHIGWRDGAPREAFDLPAEVEAERANFPPGILPGASFTGWGPLDWDRGNFPPYIFYAMWKYALTTEDPPALARLILARSVNVDGSSKLEAVPSNELLARYPFAHNAFIAGYLGYLKLEELAGYAESPTIKAHLERILALRAASFSKDTPYTSGDYCRTLSVSRNFIFLTPELGDYLHDHALVKVQSAVDEYERVAPWWFVGMTQQAILENAVQPLYDVYALFQAKALILKEPRAELAKYLDVPAFARGDLFYIHNLITLLEASQ